MRSDPERADLALADAHYGLLCFLAHREAQRVGRDFDDVVAWGWFGLVRAAKTFDPSRGLAFTTHAAPRIRGAILDGMRTDDPAPRSYRQRLRHTGEHRTLASSSPTSSPRVRWERDTMHAMLTAESLSVLITDDGQRALEEFVAVGADHELDPRLDADGRALLFAAVDRLPDAERRVIVGSYLHERKLFAIAEEMGLSEARISQIRKSALARLRAWLPTLAPELNRS